MAYPVLAMQNSWYRTERLRSYFTKIHILDSYEPTGLEIETWNADDNNIGSIKCHVVGTELIIAGDGSGMISANPDSSYMFGPQVESLDDIKTFVNVTHVYGADLLDMSNVTTLAKAFAYSLSLEFIDVSKWDLGKVTSIEYIFGTNGNAGGEGQGKIPLKHLDVSNWNVSNCTSFKNAFLCCKLLEHLDVSKWDVSSGTNFNSTFRGCMALKSLQIENWDVSNATDMRTMFSGCNSIVHLDVSRWDNGKVSVANMNATFGDTDSLETIKIGKGFKFGDGSLQIDSQYTTWYTLRGDSYSSKNMPCNVAMTFYASPLLVAKVLATPVMVSGETVQNIAEAIRGKLGTTDDVHIPDFAAAIRSMI